MTQRGLRTATVGDAFALSLLGARAYAFRDGRPAPAGPSGQALRAWSTVLARAGTWCLVRTDGEGDLLAEVSGFPIDPNEQPTAASSRHYISSLTVAPDHWGKGLGSALLTTALEHRDGVREFEVWVDCNNPRACGVYERTGFAGTGRIREYGDITTKELRLSSDLQDE